MKLSHRQVPLFGFIFTSSSLLAAYYLQYFQGLEPCPLCTLQRIIYFLLAALFLIATIHGPAAIGRKIYASFVILLSLLGCFLGARHVWLQNLPKDQIPACGPSWDVLVNNFPLIDVFRIALKGNGDCAIVSWKMLGLTLAEWSLLCFIILMIVGIYYWLKSCFIRFN